MLLEQLGQNEEFPIKFEVPFSASNKYSISISEEGEKDFVAIRGAPEKVFGMCTKVQRENEVCAITEEYKKLFYQILEGAGNNG